jgi:hypothetical protein
MICQIVSPDEIPIDAAEKWIWSHRFEPEPIDSSQCRVATWAKVGSWRPSNEFATTSGLSTGCSVLRLPDRSPKVKSSDFGQPRQAS